MHHDYDFLIVGGGMVADAAANGIREQGADGTIGIVGEEPTAPFPRPALSKKLWTDPEFTVEKADPDTAGETGATLHLGSAVTAVDAGAKTVTTEAGDTFGYGRLLVATGGHPKTIEGLPASDKVLYYRSLTDYHRLRALAGGGVRVAVVGGGYIGSEIAAALSPLDCEVTLIHPQEVLNDAMLPEPLASRFQALFADAGVRLMPGVEVSGGREVGDALELSLTNGATVDADVVVLGLGVEPAASFVDGVLERSSDGGIVVDNRLRTSEAEIFAAGDVAEYPDRILGRRRVEHVDNATTMGAAVGRIMAGSSETYDHTPMFYSDVLGFGYEAVGATSTSFETVVEETGSEGTVVYYLDENEVRGVLIWDGEGGLDAARALLAAHTRPANGSDLIGALHRAAS